MLHYVINVATKTLKKLNIYIVSLPDTASTNHLYSKGLTSQISSMLYTLTQIQQNSRSSQRHLHKKNHPSLATWMRWLLKFPASPVNHSQCKANLKLGVNIKLLLGFFKDYTWLKSQTRKCDMWLNTPCTAKLK